MICRAGGRHIELRFCGAGQDELEVAFEEAVEAGGGSASAEVFDFWCDADFIMADRLGGAAAWVGGSVDLGEEDAVKVCQGFGAGAAGPGAERAERTLIEEVELQVGLFKEP